MKLLNRQIQGCVSRERLREVAQKGDVSGESEQVKNIAYRVRELIWRVKRNLEECLLGKQHRDKKEAIEGAEIR